MGISFISVPKANLGIPLPAKTESVFKVYILIFQFHSLLFLLSKNVVINIILGVRQFKLFSCCESERVM